MQYNRRGGYGEVGNPILWMVVGYENNAILEPIFFSFFRAYFPELGDDTVLPTFDFAEMCLLNARRLARPEDSDAEESRFLTILTTSAYVALRLRKFRSSLDTANKVLESNNVPRVQK